MTKRSNTFVSARCMILAILRSGPNHGLGILNACGDRTGGLLAPHQGNIYPTLRALEEEKLIRVRQRVGVEGRGGRERIVYDLTAAGRRESKRVLGVLAKLFNVTDYWVGDLA